MRKQLKYLFTLILLLWLSHTTLAQDVYIRIPAHSIFNKSEVIIVETVMNTEGHDKWNPSGQGNIPRIKSIGSVNFKHTSLPNTNLPPSVLLWQIHSIGGTPAPFRKQESLPSYEFFTSSYKPWYYPHSTNGDFSPGNIDFSFKIPSSEMTRHSFYAGNYKLDIEQDYYQRSHVSFSPERFSVFITIPEAIQWLITPNSKLMEVNSLNQYRPSQPNTRINLGPMEVAHTVDFELFAKAGTNSIRFTSLNGNTRDIDIDIIRLGSTNSNIATLALTQNWVNYSVNNDFIVTPGNRTAFELQLEISREDFRTHFFEAGTYRFNVEIEARGSNTSIREREIIEVTVVVPNLHQITIPGGNSEVNFTFDNPIKYSQGISSTIPNQLRISNNDNYELYVKSETNQFSSNGIPSDIDASILEVGIEGSAAKVPLSTSSQKIINEGVPGLDQYLNMVYSISSSAAKTLISKEKKSYEINVVYSFTAI